VQRLKQKVLNWMDDSPASYLPIQLAAALGAAELADERERDSKSSAKTF
jgi:hypothetical protein